MNFHYLSSKSSSSRTKQSPYYPRVLLPKDSNQVVNLSTSINRHNSSSLINGSNCSTLSEGSFNTQQSSSSLCSNKHKNNRMSSSASVYFSRSIGLPTPKDPSTYMPTLFNFRNQNQHVYHSTALRRRRLVNSNRHVLQTCDALSNSVERGLRVLQSKKRAPFDLNQSQLSDNNSGSSSDYENLLNVNSKRRRTCTSNIHEIDTTRFSSLLHCPMPPQVDIASLGCLQNANDTNFSFTSIRDLTNNELLGRSDEKTAQQTPTALKDHKYVQTPPLEIPMDDLSQQEFRTKMSTQTPVLPPSSICTESLANSQAAIALRRKIPYMSPSELEAHLIAKSAFNHCSKLHQSDNQPTYSTFSDDEDDEFDVMMKHPKSSSSHVPTDGALSSTSTSSLLLSSSASSSTSSSTSSISSSTSVVYATCSFVNQSAPMALKDECVGVQGFTTEEKNEQPDSVALHRSSLANFLASLDDHEGAGDESDYHHQQIKCPSSLNRSHLFGQNDADSRIKRIRTLLSAKSSLTQKDKPISVIASPVVCTSVVGFGLTSTPSVATATTASLLSTNSSSAPKDQPVFGFGLAKTSIATTTAGESSLAHSIKFGVSSTTSQMLTSVATTTVAVSTLSFGTSTFTSTTSIASFTVTNKPTVGTSVSLSASVASSSAATFLATSTSAGAVSNANPGLSKFAFSFGASKSDNLATSSQSNVASHSTTISSPSVFTTTTTSATGWNQASPFATTVCTSSVNITLVSSSSSAAVAAASSLTSSTFSSFGTNPIQPKGVSFAFGNNLFKTTTTTSCSSSSSSSSIVGLTKRDGIGGLAPSIATEVTTLTKTTASVPSSFSNFLSKTAVSTSPSSLLSSAPSCTFQSIAPSALSTSTAPFSFSFGKEATTKTTAPSSSSFSSPSSSSLFGMFNKTTVATTSSATFVVSTATATATSSSTNLFNFGSTAASNPPKPFAFGLSSSVATTSTSATSNSGGNFVFGSGFPKSQFAMSTSQTTPNFPTFGMSNVKSTASTSTTGTNLFQFASSQSSTTSASNLFGTPSTFGSSSVSSFGSASNFGFKSSTSAPSFGSFGSTAFSGNNVMFGSSTTTATNIFGLQTHSIQASTSISSTTTTTATSLLTSSSSTLGGMFGSKAPFVFGQSSAATLASSQQQPQTTGFLFGSSSNTPTLTNFSTNSGFAFGSSNHSLPPSTVSGGLAFGQPNFATANLTTTSASIGGFQFGTSNVSFSAPKSGFNFGGVGGSSTSGGFAFGQSAFGDQSSLQGSSSNPFNTNSSQNSGLVAARRKPLTAGRRARRP